MNERIRVLAEQAGLVGGGYANGTKIMTWRESFDNPGSLEKFAELIGKEYLDCIDIMEKIANSSNASIPKDYDKYTYLKTLESLKGLLKVHFEDEEDEE